MVVEVCGSFSPSENSKDEKLDKPTHGHTVYESWLKCNSYIHFYAFLPIFIVLLKSPQINDPPHLKVLGHNTAVLCDVRGYCAIT